MDEFCHIYDGLVYSLYVHECQNYCIILILWGESCNEM